MVNKIWFDGSLLLDIVIENGIKLCIFENGLKISRRKLLDKVVEIECSICNKRICVKLYHKREITLYKCRNCYNPFRGKHHTDEYKKRLSENRKGKRLNPHSKSVYEWWLEKYGKKIADQKFYEYSKKLSKSCSGEKNGFYKKNHSKESIKRAVEKTKKTVSKRSKEEKEKISKKISESQKRYKEKNPEKYRADKSKAAKASINSRKKYSKSNPEKLIELELQKRNINYQYSVIFCDKQFDFGVGPKEYKILLEVQGDYWHGNPKKYKTLNNVQIKNQANDRFKEELAKKYNFKLFYIWEDDILKNNFTIIDNIESLINEIQSNTN